MAETTAAKSRMRTRGLLNWLRKNPNAVAFFLASKAFGPNCPRRRLASSVLSPPGAQCSEAIRASGDWLQYWLIPAMFWPIPVVRNLLTVLSCMKTGWLAS
jgi:hypothetical protein